MDIVDIIYLVFAAVSLIFNILIIAYVFSAKHRTLAMMTRGSLAVADFGFAGLFIVVRILLTYILLEKNAVRALTVLKNYFNAAGFYNISLMSLQKLYAIKFPFKYARITQSRHFLHLILFWCLGIPGCLAYYILPLINGQFNILPLGIANAVLPLSITIISTVAMCVIYYLDRKGTKGKFIGNQKRPGSNLVKINSVIASAYIMTNGPISLTIVFRATMSKWVRVLTQVCILLSGIVNFVAFCSLDREFRVYMKSLVPSNILPKRQQEFKPDTVFSLESV